MREDIKSFLTKVRKPGRYTGGETGSVYKNKDEMALRVAFCFPDTYEIGMSNLGLRILCGVFNSLDRVWCERVFAPWTDMEEEMRSHGVPLYAQESGDELKVFDIVAFTLQYELCYTTALNMLDLAGIPLRSEDRGEEYPVILAGGPCSYNPEPVADFIDIFSIGEGEEALRELAELYISMKDSGEYTKKEFLRRASHLEGFYVPSLYDVSYNDDGTVKAIEPKYPDVPKKIRKRIISDLDSVYVPTEPVLPTVETVHDRITLEVFRGCIRGCRFCQAGFVTRPVREKSPDVLCEQAKKIADCTGYDEISMCCLSISDYSKVNTFTDKLLEWTDDERINLSLPSLRADSFTEELMAKISTVRSSTLTFAPEAGSQRLRDVINKNVTEADILRAAGVAFRAGKNQVKLYFMNGLPYETDEDIKGIAALAKSVIAEYYRTDTGGGKKRPPQVTLSVACFIPKPFTPFQWERQNTAEELEKKQKLLMSEINDRRIRYNYHDAKVSRLEAVFARGSRRLAPALEEAQRRGMRFDAWEEMFDYDKWMDVFEKTGIDPAFFANREMGEDEVLPWDMLDCGVTKEFMLKERKKAVAAATTPSCKEKCSGCGANKLVDPEYCRWCPGHKEEDAEYLGQKISKPVLRTREDTSAKRDARGAGAAINPGKKPVKTVIFRFSESGALVYVSHLDIARAVTRALIKTRLPLYYTEGFNPIPKLTFASPLSVGSGGENELARFKLCEDVDDETVLEKLRAAMPEGIYVKEVYSAESNFKQIAWAENVIEMHCGARGAAEKINKKFEGPVSVLKRTKSTEKEIDISPLIKSFSAEDTDFGVRITAVTRADSSDYLNPEYVAKAAAEIADPDGSGYWEITRKHFMFEDGTLFR